MKKTYFPRRDSDLYTFEVNFISKLPEYSETLGLDQAEITETIGILNKHLNSFTEMNSKRAQSKAAREENQIQKNAGKKELSRIASKIKACKNYTDSIGDDLGIIGPEMTLTELSDVKPSLSSKLNGSEVILKFIKEHCDGVNIYTRRGDETEYTLLGYSKSSPYSDNRAKLDRSKPEYREYNAVYVKDGYETGHRSDVIKVTVS
ncbi:MAG TPA: hypothetical protein PKA90_16240 [Ignavibacteria bacterium]|nr:hypothetical protein [Ignavibacteria bacterium]HMR41967.1 hypothetical protein [Ignavibacteria bacterium]